MNDSGISLTTRRLRSVVGFVSTAVGIVLVTVGSMVVVRGGFGGAADQPVVGVAGLTHSPLLGIIEISAGVLVALAGLTDTAGSVLFCAGMLAVFGLFVVVDPARFHRRLAATPAHGWWAIAFGAALAAGVLVPPRLRTRAARLAGASAGNRRDNIPNERARSYDMSKNLDQAQGRIKQAAADLTDNPELDREGRRQETAGKVKDKFDDAVDKVKDTFDNTVDKVKDRMDGR